MTDPDRRDRASALRILAALVLVLLVAGLGLMLALPNIGAIAGAQFAPGLGLKTAAVIAFAVSVGVLIVFAVFAGDGLVGEIQFMIGGFGSFFLIFWLMIAWIF